jgi:hypothetical protein
MIAVAEAVWRRVNFRHSFRDRRYGFVHDDIFGRFDDFELGNAPIFLNSNFDESRNFAAGRDAGGRLNPGAVKAIMKHVAVPAEFRRATSAPCTATLRR